MKVTQPDNGRERRIRWTALALLLITCAVVHLTQLRVAPYLDEGDFVSSGRVLSRGGMFYVDTWNERGPYVYLQTAVWFLIAPPTLTSARLLGAALALLQMVLLYELARRWIGGRAALAAPAFYLAWHPLVMGLFYLPEHTSGVMTLEVLLLLFTSDGRKSALRIAAGGVVLACLVIDKQTALAMTLVVGGWMLVRRERTRGGTPAIVWLLAAFAVPWALLAVPYLATGHIHELIWGLLFPLTEYRHDEYLAVARGINWALYGPLFFAIGCHLVSLGIRRRSFTAAYVIWTLAALATAGPSFFAHHALIILLPASIAVAGLLDVARRETRRWPAAVVLVAIVAWSLISAVTTTRWRAEQLAPDRWTEIRHVSEFIRTHSAPSDRIWVFPHESTIYAFSGRDSACRFPFLLPWTASETVMREIVATITGPAPPSRIVYSNFYVDTSPGRPPAEFAAPVVDVIAERYRIEGVSPSGLVVLAYAGDEPDSKRAELTRRVLTADELPRYLPRLPDTY